VHRHPTHRQVLRGGTRSPSLRGAWRKTTPQPRSDMLLLGGMRDPRSSSMRFTEGMAPPPRRSTRSSSPPPYKPKNSEYGFIILSKEEEERLKFMKGRLRANY